MKFVKNIFIARSYKVSILKLDEDIHIASYCYTFLDEHECEKEIR